MCRKKFRRKFQAEQIFTKLLIKSGSLGYFWTRKTLKHAACSPKKTRIKGYTIRNVATAHTAIDTLTILEGMFGDQERNCGLLPKRSPYLIPCGLYLWKNFKDNVYKT
jgi:hypothetical protein